MYIRLIGRTAIALALAAAVSAAPVRATSSVTFTTQRLVSFSGVAVTRDFEPEIQVGPDGTVYAVANYHDTATGTRAVELWSGPFGTPLAADGLLQPPRGGQDVDIAVGSSGNLYDATLYLQSVNNGVGSYGIGVGACPAGSIPTQMSSCYGQQRVNNSHTDRPWIAADGPSTVYLSYHDGSQSGQIDVAKSDRRAGRRGRRSPRPSIRRCATRPISTTCSATSSSIRAAGRSTSRSSPALRPTKAAR